MKITLIDSRRLAVVLIRDGGFYWDPATEGWDRVFDLAKHLILFRPFDATNPAFNTVIQADLGNVMLQYQDAAAVIVTIDNHGIVAPVDQWTVVAFQPSPAVGGLRGP